MPSITPTRGRQQRSVNIWPGFVDALATLLLVVIFVLMVFMVAQFFLSTALTGRDQALRQLESEIAELSELLALERSANADLRINVAELSAELQTTIEENESLSSQLAALTDSKERLESRLAAITGERDRLAAQRQSLSEEREALQRQLAELSARNQTLERDLAAARQQGETLQEQLTESQTMTADLAAELEDAYGTIEANKETIEAQLAELAILRDLRDQLRREVAALDDRVQNALAALEAQEESLEAAQSKVANLTGQLEESEDELAGALARIDRLTAKLAESREDLTQTEETLSQREKALAQQTEISEEQLARIDLLNRQLAALRRQLSSLQAALEASEALNQAQDVEIQNLSKRLNAALATRVQELARYRSEFFGRLRELIGDRKNIRIEGDRFVFQSEVLFESGEAELEPAGRRQLAALAETLEQIAAEIPEDIDWVLRVDGHTDRRPISTAKFPSNWELSTARAISVVRFLMERGIPADRLAATGFAHYQPLDSGDDEIAYRRNRRIELKLTNR